MAFKSKRLTKIIFSIQRPKSLSAFKKKIDDDVQMKIFVKLLKSSNKTSEWDYESAGKKKR